MCLGSGERCSDERCSLRHLEILALENLDHHHASKFGFYLYGGGGAGRNEQPVKLFEEGLHAECLLLIL